MTPADSEPLVRQIHAGQCAFVLAITGGGSQAVGRLLAVPGASRTVLEAVVPYSARALERFLGGPPDHCCSPTTARAMAMAAYRRAEHYAPDRPRLAGVACTASLATDRPKRGPHRLHAALQTAEQTTAVSLELAKGQRSRAAEEHLTATLLLNLIAEAVGLVERLPLDLLPGERLDRVWQPAPAEWQALLAGRIERVVHHGAISAPADPVLILPGAFHPLHAGHRGMAAFAALWQAAPAAYELSILNVDKPPLDFVELERRVRQFAADETLWLTRAATFVEKARLFPGATFAVGADTIQRIADPKYYGGSAAALEHALASIAERGCRFLVFGRLMGGAFRQLESLPLPPALARLCTAVPEASFRADVSSTELRSTSVLGSAAGS